MTSLDRDRFRGAGAVVLAALISCVGVQPVWAATGSDSPAASPPTTGAEKPPTTTPDQGGATPDQAPPAAAAPVPQLQLQDEGPPARDADVAQVSRRRVVIDDAEERPFWKHWIFWGVTGALVAGAVGMIIYTASGTDTSLAPCPPDIVVSLGCFGSGRAQ